MYTAKAMIEAERDHVRAEAEETDEHIACSTALHHQMAAADRWN